MGDNPLLTQRGKGPWGVALWQPRSSPL